MPTLRIMTRQTKNPVLVELLFCQVTISNYSVEEGYKDYETEFSRVKRFLGRELR